MTSIVTECHLKQDSGLKRVQAKQHIHGYPVCGQMMTSGVIPVLILLMSTACHNLASGEQMLPKFNL